MRGGFAAVGIALLLFGCEAADPKPAGFGDLACPSAGGLEEATHQTKFRSGGGRDLTDVLYEIDLVDVTLECDYGSGEVDLDVTAQFRIDRGPADTEREGLLRYFVAFVLPGPQTQESVIRRVPRQLVFRFPETASRIQVTESITLEDMPFPRGREYDPKAFWVVVGIRLTEAELQYNRNRR